MNEIDYIIILNEILDKIEYIRIMDITFVSLYVFDFIWKKIRQPKKLRGGVDE